jgi:hypothetical protein
MGNCRAITSKEEIKPWAKAKTLEQRDSQRNFVSIKDWLPMEASTPRFSSLEIRIHTVLRWSQQGVFEDLNRQLVKLARIKKGRTPDSSAEIVDSQSVKTTEKGASKDTTGERKSRVEKGTYWLILKG